MAEKDGMDSLVPSGEMRGFYGTAKCGVNKAFQAGNLRQMGSNVKNVLECEIRKGWMSA